jgi:hypothetical protein
VLFNSFCAFLFQVLEHLILRMKEQDALFKRVYSRICGAGSYYDGLKVGKPEEFDMDIVIRLPINYEEVVVSHLAVSPPIFEALTYFLSVFLVLVSFHVIFVIFFGIKFQESLKYSHP